VKTKTPVLKLSPLTSLLSSLNIETNGRVFKNETNRFRNYYFSVPIAFKKPFTSKCNGWV